MFQNSLYRLTNLLIILVTFLFLYDTHYSRYFQVSIYVTL